jgi:hypothetical protein
MVVENVQGCDNRSSPVQGADVIFAGTVDGAVVGDVDGVYAYGGNVSRGVTGWLGGVATAACPPPTVCPQVHDSDRRHCIATTIGLALGITALFITLVLLAVRAVQRELRYVASVCTCSIR